MIEPGSGESPANGRPEPLSPLKQLARQGSVYTLGTAAQMVGGLVSLPIVTRLLQPSEYGIVAAAFVVTSVLSSLAPLGLQGALTREYFEGSGGPERARSLVAAIAVAVIAISAVAHVTGPIWSRAFGGLDYGTPLTIAVWTVPPLALVAASQSLLLAQQRPAPFVVVGLVCSLGGQGLGLALAHGASRPEVLYLTGVASGAVAGGFLGFVVVGMKFAAAPSRPLLRRALALGLPTVPHAIGIYVLAAGDRVVIERLEGLAEVGRYQVVYGIGALGIAALVAFNNAWSPLIYSADLEELPGVVVETAAAVLRLASILAAGLALVGPILVDLIAPSAYDTGALRSVVVAVGASVVPYAIYLSNVNVLFVFRRSGVLAIATPAIAGMNIALNFLFVPTWGLVGAAVATFVSYAAWAALVAWATRLRLRTGWRWPLFHLGLAVAAMVPGALLPVGGAGALLRLVLAGGVGAVGVMELRRMWAS